MLMPVVAASSTAVLFIAVPAWSGRLQSALPMPASLRRRRELGASLTDSWSCARFFPLHASTSACAGKDFRGPRKPSSTRSSSSQRFPNPLQRLFDNKDELIEVSGWFALGSSLVVLARVTFFNPTCVPSSSMFPTLQRGDCVLVDTFSYRVGFQPIPGDVDMTENDEPVQYVKRVVAMAGDTVEVRDGKVVVNGEPRLEEALRVSPDAADVLKAKYSVAQVEVPPNSLFVLGDNRNRSIDSHVWSFLPKQNVVGRCWWRFAPGDRVGPIQ
eukprot:jgi/Chlat1/7900/Chrsp66S07324